MPAKGPLRIAPRPFAQEQLTVIIREDDINARTHITGPLGGNRPFATSNPPQTIDKEDFIEQCKNSEWAIDLVDGLDRFVGGDMSEQRKQELIDENCEDMAQTVQFPISEQFRRRILGREITR